ncbi:MAG: hypothetical protein ACWA5X_08425 [bacterium]
MKQRINGKRLAGITAAVLLSGCSSPKDPYASACMKLAENLSGIHNAQWEPAEKKEVKGEYLRVNLFSPQTTASCYFMHEEESMMDHDFAYTEYSMSPYEVHMNGAKIGEADLVKAAVTVLGKDAKQAIEQAGDNARQLANDAATATGQVVEKVKEGARQQLLNTLEK